MRLGRRLSAGIADDPIPSPQPEQPAAPAAAVTLEEPTPVEAGPQRAHAALVEQ